jgi:hypothetical protein
VGARDFIFSKISPDRLWKSPSILKCSGVLPREQSGCGKVSPPTPHLAARSERIRAGSNIPVCLNGRLKGEFYLLFSDNTLPPSPKRKHKKRLLRVIMDKSATMCCAVHVPCMYLPARTLLRYCCNGKTFDQGQIR